MGQIVNVLGKPRKHNVSWGLVKSESHHFLPSRFYFQMMQGYQVSITIVESALLGASNRNREMFPSNLNTKRGISNEHARSFLQGGQPDAGTQPLLA